MIKVESYYDKEKIVKMSKKMQVKALVSSSILSIVMLAMGIINIISAVSGEKFNVFSLIVGILVSLFAFYPIISVIKTNKGSVKRAVKDMNVEKDPVVINYEFKEKRVEISLTQNGVTKLDTLMLKNVDKVRTDKNGLAIYIQNGDMYYIGNEDFIEGSRERLISLFAHNKIQVK